MPSHQDDFETIEQAVMETSRGRWFLAEYGRRNRNADTAAVLAALERIQAMAGTGAAPSRDAGPAVRCLASITAAIDRLRNDFAGLVGRLRDAPPRPMSALDDILREAEQGVIVSHAAEHRTQAWLGSSEGGATAVVDRRELAQHARELAVAARWHALTTARMRALCTVLAHIESHARILVGPEPGRPDADAVESSVPVPGDPHPRPDSSASPALTITEDDQFAFDSVLAGQGKPQQPGSVSLAA